MGHKSINNRGEVAGSYGKTQTTFHGFVRDARGTIITSDPPGATSTEAFSINNRGEVAGVYFDAGAALMVSFGGSLEETMRYTHRKATGEHEVKVQARCTFETFTLKKETH